MASQEPTQDFEALLETNPQTYGQYCWSLANNVEEEIEAGQIFACSGPCEEHGEHQYDFRLTEVSLANIAACKGLDTCGEAIERIVGRSPHINRAARRRAQREAAKGGDYTPAGITPDGILGVQMSKDLMTGHDNYGLPEKASRQWLEEHSDKDEGLGIVPIPVNYQDDHFTHAQYMVFCEHEEDCQCEEDPNGVWELESFSG